MFGVGMPVSTLLPPRVDFDISLECIGLDLFAAKINYISALTTYAMSGTATCN
jgi:hypothetical protein